MLLVPLRESPVAGSGALGCWKLAAQGGALANSAPGMKCCPRGSCQEQRKKWKESSCFPLLSLHSPLCLLAQ